jgi:hypothetical protein
MVNGPAPELLPQGFELRNINWNAIFGAALMQTATVAFVHRLRRVASAACPLMALRGHATRKVRRRHFAA